MAELSDAHPDRPAMTDPPNQPAPQARPASRNNEHGSTSTPSRVSSKSPRPTPPQAFDSTAKPIKPESQPMTTTSSSSSLPPDHQANNAMDSNGASPYGTRSRNRTGNPRPNYAEDRELEMDVEWTSSRKSQNAVGSAVPSILPPASGDSEKPTTATTRRSSIATPVVPTTVNKAMITNTQNNHLPGMSSFSVNPETSMTQTAPSRKRKAPGSGPTIHHPPSAVSQNSTPTVARRNPPPGNTGRLRTTNLMTFDTCQGYLKGGKLKADDGTVLAVNDQIYLVCEPPGEPYYLARIMEFLHVDNDHSQPVDSLRVNWYFRPKDIQRKVNDTRVVFASMQSDTSPITSLRGKCRVLHRNDIHDLDMYRKEQDSFWYEKMFDRYIHRFYEVIPTSQVINVPAKVKDVLDQRWKFVVVEIGRGKELTSAIKSCKRCVGYCASNDSVDCAVCKDTYHMNCVRPPLLKKPARGFGWSCGPCSRKQEKKLEARNTPIVGEKAADREEEVVDEEEDEHGAGSNSMNNSDADAPNSGSRPPTAEQIAQAKLWPYRYLGIHCRVEDALDYDDRIYPRASSRLGPKHQANVPVWHGHPVEFVKPKDIKKKFVKGNSHKKDAKLTKDTIAALEADKTAKDQRPKWIMDEPPGYVARGEDHANVDSKNTARLQFRLPEVGEKSSRGDDLADTDMTDERYQVVDHYMEQAKTLAGVIGLPSHSTNFLDKALELLTTNKYQAEKALEQLRHMDARKDLKEPVFNQEEGRKFEEGVARYGSELLAVSRYMGKNTKHGEVVRYYYMWKKSPRGRDIWGTYEGRKGKKQIKQADSKLVDDVADDVDDSAFDNRKALAKKRGFECKFCATRQSPQWRRAPATAPGTTVPLDPAFKNSKDKNAHLMLALCQRCAALWRCYGIQWENLDEVARKVASGGGRAWKRRIDEELLIELTSANLASSIGISTTAAAAAASVGVEIPPGLTIQPGQDGPKKKQKMAVDNHAMVGPQSNAPIEAPKKKIVEKPPEPPLIPEQPRIRILPCAVCEVHEPMDQHFVCRNCRLTVHRDCYGIAEGQGIDRWVCDMCTNDNTHQHQYSSNYECVLCPVRHYTDTELMEAPKASHKKKNDREREKERLEKEMVVTATENYLLEQKKRGRPEYPRQALKRTSQNNWAHVVCAVFHFEIKFGEATRLEPAEGFGAISTAKWAPVCKLCKTSTGACINCSHCQATVHVACAQQYGYPFGFHLTPVKNSRTSAVNIVTMDGETGNATAVVYCREHTLPKDLPVLHPMSKFPTDGSYNNLQAFVRSHKQADTSLTGTLRKAHLTDFAKVNATQLATSAVNHRDSTSSAASGAVASVPATRSSRASPGILTVKSEEVDQDGDRVVHLSEVAPAESCSKECAACGADASPKWHVMMAKVTPEPQASIPPLTAESDVNTSDAASQLVNGHSNGHVNGHGSEGRPESTAPILSFQTEVAPITNGGTGLDGAGDSGGPTQEQGQGSDLVLHGGEKEPELANGHALIETPKFFCHKCHLRKLREPTPPRTPTPQPEPEPEAEPVQSVQPEVDTALEPEQPISPHASGAPMVWPSQVAQASPHESYRPPWPSQPGPSYHAPERLTNGVPPSPPAAAPLPPPPQHYVTQPAHYQPPQMLPQTYRDSRGVLHRGIPPQYHVPHLVNGVPVEPPSFQYRRDSQGQLRQVPYVPPAMRAPPPHAGSHVRSPSMHDRSSQGPHGPPEAAENPFAVPNNAAHSPPRPPFRGMYRSPASNHERPHTPPDAFGRDGRWPSEGPMANGASASPSLRNLLH